MANFPTSAPSFAGFTSSHTLSADNHAAQHNLEQGEIVALAAKMGTGASTPVVSRLLRGTGTGTSAWAQADLTADVTGVLPVANGGLGQNSLTSLPLVSPAITGTVSGGATFSSPTLTTPIIGDFTNATHTHASNAQGGQLNGANAITDGTITPAELDATAGTSWAWQSWTPTITATAGTFTSVAATGTYIQIGKTIIARLDITITTNGTAATDIITTLPVASKSSNGAIGYGREDGVTGNMMQARLTSTTQAKINKYDGTYLGGDGGIPRLRLIYEAA